MENKENILQELREISEVVANLPKGNTFTVPSTYFETLPAVILAQIHADNGDFGAKTAPFAVPNGYFDGLADNILNRIKQQDQSVEEELNELAPLLNTINKKPVYTVPDGYFESLEVTIPMKVSTPPAKVVGFRPRRILQYAIAACTAGILMVGAYLYTNQTTGTDTSSTAAVIPYDSAVKMDVKEELANVDVTEIDQYLTESPVVSYFIPASVEEVDVDQYMKSASDEEIKEYLNQTSQSSKANSGT